MPMKATGITRQIDDLGRIVIPKELRRVMDIKESDALEIFVEGNKIILKKYVPGCVICGNVVKSKLIGDKQVCLECISELTK
jgi:AbrB family transcriptional regulator, transcriptional pleiotropic regulator of transition state genes